MVLSAVSFLSSSRIETKRLNDTMTLVDDGGIGGIFLSLHFDEAMLSICIDRWLFLTIDPAGTSRLRCCWRLGYLSEKSGSLGDSASRSSRTNACVEKDLVGGDDPMLTDGGGAIGCLGGLGRRLVVDSLILLILRTFLLAVSVEEAKQPLLGRGGRLGGDVVGR